MIPKGWMITGGIALIVTVVIGYQALRLDTLEAQRDRAEEQRDNARANLEKANAAIEQLRAMNKQKAEDRAQLRKERQALQEQASTRQTKIRRLQRDNEELRQWADGALPEPVARMRQRPALTSASDYREHLRNAGSLPAPGGQSGDERGSEPADRED